MVMIDSYNNPVLTPENYSNKTSMEDYLLLKEVITINKLVEWLEVEI
jgi:hypothetical protein